MQEQLGTPARGARETVALPGLRRLAWAVGLLVGGILLSVVLDIFSAPGDGDTLYGLARRLLPLPCALAAVVVALDFVTVTRDGLGFWTLSRPGLVAFTAVTALDAPDGQTLVLTLAGGRSRRLNLAGRVNGHSAAAAIVRGLQAANPRAAVGPGALAFLR